MDYFPYVDLMLQQGLKKPFVVISPSLLNKPWNIFKLVLVQMSCFIGGLVTWFLQHPNVFKVQMHSIQKCKINSKAKELKLNVVSVKLAQYLDNIICNQNLK